jgi:hypothetical protein
MSKIANSPPENAEPVWWQEERLREAIAASPPILRDQAVQLAHNHQVPLELPLALTLGAAAMACSGTLLVRSPYGYVRPPTLYMTVIAEPGSRKSSVLKALLQPFIDFDREARAQIGAEATQRDAQREDAENQGDARARATAPPPLGAAATMPDLKWYLTNVSSSANLVFSEGSEFFGSPLSCAFGDLREFYDGNGPRTRRKIVAAHRTDYAFVNMIVATSKQPFDEYISCHYRKALRGAYLSRMQIVRVPPLVDTSFLAQRPTLDAGQQNYSAWVRAELHKRAGAADESMEVRFDAQATQLFRERAAELRGRVQAHFYDDYVMYLTCLPDLWCRVACIMHVVDKRQGDISAETLRASMTICDWLAAHHVKAMWQTPDWAPLEETFDIVHEVIAQEIRNGSLRYFRESDILKLVRRHGSDGMTRRKLQFALQKLCLRGHARILFDLNGTEYIELGRSLDRSCGERVDLSR